MDPAPGHRPDPGEHRAHHRHPAAGPRRRPVRARSVAIPPSTAAAGASSADSGSSRSSCSSSSSSSRWRRSSSPRPPPPDPRTAAAHRDPALASESDDPDRLARRRDPGRAARAHRGPRRRPVALSTTASPATPLADRPSLPRQRGRTARASLGRPVSVSPLTARTQADRDLVALVFSGLVRNGPNGTLVPDLAEHWTVDPTGATWTFQLRDDARWHDGEPVTAEDVAFTIRVLQDPGVHRARRPAPGTRSPSRPSACATVVVHAGDAARRVPPGRDPADRPGPSAGRRPGRPSWPTTRSGRQPIGSGPFAVTALDDDTRRARPGRGHGRSDGEPDASDVAAATDSLATPVPTRPPDPAAAVPGRDRVPLLRRPEALAAAYRAGELDAASRACRRQMARGSRRDARQPRAALPGLDADRRPPEPAPGHPEFADPAVRTALLEAIDRSAIIATAFAAARGVGQRPDPAVARRCSTRWPTRRSPTIRPRRPQPSRRPAGPRPPTAGTCRKAQGAPRRSSWSARTQASNPAAYAAARGGRRTTGRRSASRSPTCRSPRATSSPAGWPRASSRPRSGTSRSASTPISTRCWRRARRVTGGSNVIGLQDPALDKLLVAARGPGTMTAREGRLFGPPEAAGEGSLPAPAGLRGRVDRGPRRRSADRSSGRSPTRLIDFGMC